MIGKTISHYPALRDLARREKILVMEYIEKSL